MSLSYVLVHGAWHGAWCWRKVVPLLERAGHRAVAVTLTGQGDRVHLTSPAVDLATHVQDVINTLEMEDLDDVVLVGHSYGGMVVTGAAEKAAPRLRRLVYLDALVPTDGQRAFDLNSAQFRERLEREAATTGDGYKMAPMSTDLLGISDPAEAEWVRALDAAAHRLFPSAGPGRRRSAHSQHLHPVQALWLPEHGAALPRAGLAGARDRQRP